MATITTLVAEGRLHKLDPALEDDEQEERLIYMSDRVANWLVNELPEMGSSWDIETPPDEQLSALVQEYASGAILTYEWQFKPLNPIGEGVWELKTADLRVFGWFPCKDCFVAVVADRKDRILEHGLYAGYRNTVAWFRRDLPLDEPKFVEGEDPNAVVSNYTLPA